MTRFVESVLSPDNRTFRDDFVPFARRITQLGIYNSLAQLVLKITAPGVPDFYQGTELWDFSLVDPDNRRPVDYARRRALLTSLDATLASNDRTVFVSSLFVTSDAASRGAVAVDHAMGASVTNGSVTGASAMADGAIDDRVKLFTVATTLRCRQRNRALFADGDYMPLSIDGPRRDHIFAFLRRRGNALVLTAVPRLIATLVPDAHPPLGERVWGDTRIALPRLASSGLHDIFLERCINIHQDGGRTSVLASEIFDRFPVACLEGR